jgi:hypothetical protein
MKVFLRKYPVETGLQWKPRNLIVGRWMWNVWARSVPNILQENARTPASIFAETPCLTWSLKLKGLNSVPQVWQIGAARRREERTLAHQLNIFLVNCKFSTMHMHTLHNKLAKPESLWSGFASWLNFFQLCYRGKEMCFLIPLVLLTATYIVIIQLYFELLAVLLLPLFQTVQILKLWRCAQSKWMCSTLLSDFLCLHIWLLDLLLFKDVVSHSQAVLSLNSVSWLSLWFAISTGLYSWI